MEKLEALEGELNELAEELAQRGQHDVAQRLHRVASRLRREPTDLGGAFMTTGEAAQALGVRSVNTIKRWAREGLLQGARRGGRVLVSQASVEAMKERSSLAAQREFEHELAETLSTFDTSEEDIPPTGSAWEGQKPWEEIASAQA